jgi:hypothetical protein
MGTGANNSPDAQKDHDREPDPLLRLLEGLEVQRDGDREHDEVEHDVRRDVRGVRGADLVRDPRPEAVAVRARVPVPEARQRHAGHERDGREGDAPERAQHDEEPADLAGAHVFVEDADVLREQAELHQGRRDDVGE